MRDRLIELILNTPVLKFPSGSRAQGKTYQTAQNVADHLLANGVIVLPCKVGDVVYTNINGTGLQNSFMVNKVDLLGFSNGLYSWTWHQLGKSVFLTIEDAINTLKGGEPQ